MPGPVGARTPGSSASLRADRSGLAAARSQARPSPRWGLTWTKPEQSNAAARRASRQELEESLTVGAERRKAPRQAVAPGTRGQIRNTIDVDLVDVSPTGLKFELSAPLRPGSVYDLRASVGGFPLAVPVRITRCAAGGFREDGRGGKLLLFRAGAEILWRDASGSADLARHLHRSGRAREDSSACILKPRD